MTVESLFYLALGAFAWTFFDWYVRRHLDRKFGAA